MKRLFFHPEPRRGARHAAPSTQTAARRGLPGLRASGRWGDALQENPGSAPLHHAGVSGGQSVGSGWVCPHLSRPQEPAPGRAAAPVRGDLTATREDMPLGGVTALPRHCQAPRSAPAAWPGARYPHAGTHAVLERETGSRQPHSLHTPRKSPLEMLWRRVRWRHLCCCEHFTPLKGHTRRV